VDVAAPAMVCGVECGEFGQKRTWILGEWVKKKGMSNPKNCLQEPYQQLLTCVGAIGAFLQG
jgi:hypothetical protein